MQGAFILQKHKNISTHSKYPTEKNLRNIESSKILTLSSCLKQTSDTNKWNVVIPLIFYLEANHYEYISHIYAQG